MRSNAWLIRVALCALLAGVAADVQKSSSGYRIQLVTTIITVTVAPLNSGSFTVTSLVSPQAALSTLSIPTSNATYANFITVCPTTATQSVVSSDSAYYYVEDHGTTSWINDNAPPSTYRSFLTKTTQVAVYPVATTKDSVAIFQNRTSTSASTFADLAASVTDVSSIDSGRPSPGLSGWNTSTVLTPLSTTATGESAMNTRSVAVAAEHSSYSTTLRMFTVASVSLNLSRPITYGFPSASQPPSSSSSTSGYSSDSTTYSDIGVSATMLPAAPSLRTSLTSFLTRATSSAFTRVFTNTTDAGLGSMPTHTPTACGEHGDFVLNVEPITDPSDAPPVFNPYHHMYFSNGYVYLPPPRDPFPPTSEPRLVMFLTNETGPSNNLNAGGQHPGEIGAGDRASESAFWFNAHSAYLGCDNQGPEDCVMQISGYVWQDGAKEEVLVFQENVTLPACPGYKDCKLQQVKFASSMVGLSGLQMQAFVEDEQRQWYMDDLALGWYNSTCAAGLLRVRSR